MWPPKSMTSPKVLSQILHLCVLAASGPHCQTLLNLEPQLNSFFSNPNQRHGKKGQIYDERCTGINQKLPNCGDECYCSLLRDASCFFCFLCCVDAFIITTRIIHVFHCCCRIYTVSRGPTSLNSSLVCCN